MSSISAARARYMRNRHDALRGATDTLRPILGVDFRLVEFSRSTLDAIQEWGTSEFDWPEIHRRYNEPDSLKFGIWVGDRLAAAVVATTTGQSVKIQFVEGDPRGDCPLRGRRILIALEAAANYAQLRGKLELVLEPINEILIILYEDIYGFEAVRPRRETPYWRKRV